MRTLYYNIVITRKNAISMVPKLGYQYSKSNGILKIEYDEKGIKNIEGVLNLDIIVSEIQEDKIILKYYIPTENFDGLRLDAKITFETKEIKEPINLQISNNFCSTEIRTISEIINSNVEEYYDKRLEEVRNIMTCS